MRESAKGGDAGSGGEGAFDELFGELYDELRAIAARFLRHERVDHTLGPTALVHETFLRFRRARDLELNGREHFLRLAVRALRRILINHAEARATEKRGGGRERKPLEGSEAQLMTSASPAPDRLTAIDEALEELARHDERQASVVELRFFGGLTGEEIARTLGISPRTVDAEWQHGRAWLRVWLDRSG